MPNKRRLPAGRALPLSRHIKATILVPLGSAIAMAKSPEAKAELRRVRAALKGVHKLEADE